MRTLIFFSTVLVSGLCADITFTNGSQILGSLNKYYVYSREFHRHGYELVNSNASISDSPILQSRDTAIIIHGYQASAFDSLNPVVKDVSNFINTLKRNDGRMIHPALMSFQLIFGNFPIPKSIVNRPAGESFLTAHDLNIIVVDWSVYAQQTYRNAVIAVPSVGIHLANLITNLVDAEKIALDRLHIVGFNLGAHVAGFTGRGLRGEVARITGLDPSRNQWNNNAHRLTHTDALYVECIHTDGDGIKSNGISTPIGHTDFFPNGGSNQPGCFFSNLCSHNRAWELFAATVIHDHLVANRCANTLQLRTNSCRGYTLNMGNNQYVKMGSGIFRVNTRRSFPF